MSSDNNSEQLPVQPPTSQKGGTTVPSLAERGMGWKSKVANTSTGIAVAITGIASSDGSHALAQSDISSVAQTSSGQVLNMPDGAPSEQALNSFLKSSLQSPSIKPQEQKPKLTIDQINQAIDAFKKPSQDANPQGENQTVPTTLKELLKKNLLTKEEALKNPVIPTSIARQENANQETISEYFLNEDKRSNLTRIYSSAIQSDDVFSENSFVGNIAMKNAKSVAVDSKRNVVVVGRKTDAISSPAAIEVLYVNSKEFTSIPLEYGQGVSGGNLTDVFSAGKDGTFLVSTREGLQILTIDPQVTDVQKRTKLTAADVKLKPTNLSIGRVIGLAVPSDIQAQSPNIVFYATIATNAEDGVIKITLDTTTGIGTAEQLFPEIGYVDQPSLYTDSATGQSHMLVVNSASGDFFDLNLSTKKIDKTFNYVNLISGFHKNLPPGAINGAGMTTPYLVGETYNLGFSYINKYDGTRHPAFVSFNKKDNPETNPEKAQFYFPFDTDKIDAGIASLQLVTYPNGVKALVPVIAPVRVSAPSYGRVEIPLNADGTLNTVGMEFPNKNMPMYNVEVPAAPVNYSSVGK